MWKLIIFDLDNTLIHSDHLEEFRGLENVDNTSSAYKKKLLSAIEDELEVLIDEATLLAIEKQYPEAEFAVFTTSPRFYAETILDHVYPNMEWATVIGYEDVKHTKPDPEGIAIAMDDAGLDEDDLYAIAMVGDSEKDIKAAYRAGVWAILFRGGWPYRFKPAHWAAQNSMADIEVKTAKELVEALAEPDDHLWALEAHLATESDTADFQLERIHKARRFCNLHGSEGNCVVRVCGRIFTKYEALDARRTWHSLTTLIDELKKETEFPEVVIAAVRVAIRKAFFEDHSTLFFKNPELAQVLITCIPKKPGRPARMEGLVEQLEGASAKRPLISQVKLEFDAKSFSFSTGVKSHHGEHLNAEERFKNIRDHLKLVDPEKINGRYVIILDDVLTTGATTYFADKLCREAGAKGVISIALAQAISP